MIIEFAQNIIQFI